MFCEGNRLSDDITCLAVDQLFTFAACGKDVYAFRRGKQVRLSCLLLLYSKQVCKV